MAFWQRPRSSIRLPLQTSSSDVEHNRQIANCTNRGKQAGKSGLNSGIDTSG
jgi:hypothetical protein